MPFVRAMGDVVDEETYQRLCKDAERNDSTMTPAAKLEGDRLLTKTPNPGSGIFLEVGYLPLAERSRSRSAPDLPAEADRRREMLQRTVGLPKAQAYFSNLNKPVW